MNASVIKDLRYGCYLKILSKLHEPLGKCSLKKFFQYFEWWKSIITRTSVRLPSTHINIKVPLTDLFEPLLRRIYSHITSSGCHQASRMVM